MKKLLLFLLFCVISTNSNTFKIKNKVFDIEGTADKNNIIVYAELKRCSSMYAHKKYCEKIKKALLAMRPGTHTIEDLNNLKEIDDSNHKALLFVNTNIVIAIQAIAMALHGPYPPSKNLTNLVIANAAQTALSCIDNHSKYNYKKTLIGLDTAFGIANGVFIAKTISLAAPPWITTAVIGLGIVRTCANILYRIFPEKVTKVPSTVTITETENKD